MEQQKDIQLTVGSLFSGAGGMDIGFKNAGFEILWANDSDKDSCDTHTLWSGSEIKCCKVEDLDTSSILCPDVVVGGFPFQGFSLAGSRQVDDSRNSLYKFFVKCIEDLRPKIFVAENVKGLLTMGTGSVIRAIVKEFSEKGYDVQVQLLNASNYSVPQDRLRVILVGTRSDLDINFEYPTESYKVTMRDFLEKFPEPKSEEVCGEAYSSRYMSRQRVRDWDKQSFTVPAMAKQVPLHPSSPKMKLVSPDIWEFGKGVTRRVSWREAARLQTFPADMEFCGNLTSKYRQIGNAVPVKLAQAIAESVKKSLQI